MSNVGRYSPSFTLQKKNGGLHTANVFSQHEILEANDILHYLQKLESACRFSFLKKPSVILPIVLLQNE